MGNLESCEGESEGLGIDEAYVNVSLSVDRPVSLFQVSEDCVKCTPQLFAQLDEHNATQRIAVSTKHPQTIFACDGNSSVFCGENVTCSKSESLGEFGIYNWIVEDTDMCKIVIAKPPVNPNLSLLPCFGFFVVLAVFWIAVNYVFQKYRSSSEKDSSKDCQEQETPSKPKKERLISIDTFRGIAIVLMIFVNNGGGQYYFFEHATWNGLFVADLVFPWFMWIMGVCVPISIQSQLKRSGPKVVFKRILQRSVYLLVLGLILSSGNNLKMLRIFGVLQRFAITYFVVANLQLLFAKWYSKENQFAKLKFAYDVIRLLPHWICMIVLVAAHTLITFLLPVPGCQTGYLGPGGRHDNGEHWNCTGGSTGYIDRMVLGENHLYQHPTSKAVYGASIPYDPEGILGTVTSCFQVFLGVQAGVILVTYKDDPKARVIRWSFWSILLGIFGAILTKCSQEDGWIPLNKNLWSLSFVFVTSCFAFFMLTILYLVIDLKHWWNGAPFFYPGMNSTILYCGHSIAYANFPFTWVASDMGTHLMQLISSLWTTSVWVLIGMWLFYIEFFLSF